MQGDPEQRRAGGTAHVNLDVKIPLFIILNELRSELQTRRWCACLRGALTSQV